MKKTNADRMRRAAQELMAAHDELAELLPSGKKQESEEDAVLSDALDSLEECIDCLTGLLKEESK